MKGQRRVALLRANDRRRITAGITSVTLVAAGSVLMVPAAAHADTAPLPPEYESGYTFFADDPGFSCTASDDSYESPGYYLWGWEQVPDGVHHVKITAVGEPGHAGLDSGGAGGAAGAVTAIVPSYPSELFYASPGTMLSDELGSTLTAPGGHASIVSTVDPHAACVDLWSYGHYPTELPPSSIVVAAAGGGGGGNGAGGGRGGDAGAVSGQAGGSVSGASGGGGGTQTGGGAGGSGTKTDGQAGTYLAGGAGFEAVTGGNGGAGFYGGGGGAGNGGAAGAGGGGGSNHVEALPDDGVSQVVSTGTTTDAGYIRIVPIYEPTVSISAPVNPSVVQSATTIVVTVSGLPTARAFPHASSGSRPGATGTVSLFANGVEVQRSFDSLSGTDTGVRTATFTPSSSTAGPVVYTARYNGDTSQENANIWADITNPESSAAFTENYLAAVTSTVSGTMTYGDGSADFTHSETLPTGVTLAGAVTCTTADSGTALSTLAAANHLIDGSSCSGLTLGGPNAANYRIRYTGSVRVAPKPIAATITGTQPLGGTPTFTAAATTPSGITISGTPSCPTLDDGTAISPSLPRGVYPLGPCTGLSVTGTDPADYTLTVTSGRFVSGTSAPTVSLVNPTGSTVDAPFQVKVRVAGSGTDATGSVTSTLYSGATCSGQVVLTSSSGFTGDDDYASGPTSVSSPGAYSWRGRYSGDTYDLAATSACLQVTAVKAASGVTLTVPTEGTVGQALSASATLSSAAQRSTSGLRFLLFAPSDTTCTGDTALIDTGVPVTADGTYTSGSYTPTAAGTYRWVILYGGDANHEAFYSVCTLATVVTTSPTPLHVTVTGTQTYGAPDSGSFEYTVSAHDLRKGDSAAVVSGKVSCTSSAAGANVGEHAGSLGSSCTGLSAPSGYRIVYVDGGYSITPAPLTVTPNDATRLFGATNPALTATISGYVNGDTASDVTGAAACTTTATPGSGVGRYPITCTAGTLSGSSYTFRPVVGTLMVKATRTLTGTVTGGLTVRTGDAVLVTPGTTVSGPITLAGGSLEVESATLTGPVDTKGNAPLSGTVRFCHVQMSAPLTLQHLTGPILVGTKDGSCDASSSTAAVTISRNTGGGSVFGLTTTAPLTISGNSGGFTIGNDTGDTLNTTAIGNNT